jgi:lipopolysaccharide biosynthesis glycosyltransferase
LQLYLDEQLVANMEENEEYLMMEGTNILSHGEHKVTVQIVNPSGEAYGVEKYAYFSVVAGISQEEPRGGTHHETSQLHIGRHRAGFGAMPASGSEGRNGDGGDSSSDENDHDPCFLDRLQTGASGAGLEGASAGMSSQFVIAPRNPAGRVIDPQLCPDPLPLLVVIVPAPLEHQMTRSPDGYYTCRWTTEYASDIRVDIKVGLETASSIHIPGSPFAVTVQPMYRVYAEGALVPKASAYGGRLLHTSREARHHVPENAVGAPLVEGGDAAGIAAACRGPPRAGFLGRCAFVTLVSTDNYLAGALTLFYSVRKTGSLEAFVAMVTTDGLAPSTLQSLETAGMTVVAVGRLKKSDISDMSEERWNDNYTKLRLWQLGFEKIIFLDSDMIVLQPLDHLFALKSSFAAVPDAFHPCYLNTGFMVLEPSNRTFDALAALIEEVSSEESEQTLVNHYWLDRYHVLHYTYNFAKHVVMSPTRFDIYVDRYIDTVKVVHYLGVKPWLCSRDNDCMRHVPYYGGASNMYLYDLWWTMFENMCDEGPIVCVS